MSCGKKPAEPLAVRMVEATLCSHHHHHHPRIVCLDSTSLAKDCARTILLTIWWHRILVRRWHNASYRSLHCCTFSRIFSTKALETFKGGKKTKGSYIPGKGLREHESFDQLVASNPGTSLDLSKSLPSFGVAASRELSLLCNKIALETFKGHKKICWLFHSWKGNFQV